MKRPKPGDLIAFEWRDSFCLDGEQAPTDLEEDCRWISCGWVVKTTDLFLTVSSGLQQTRVGEGRLDSPLSVPWTQILSCLVVA